jgi:MFS family permease
MCLAAPQNFAGFATVRFLLGFAEGAVSPSFITMTAIWYRKSEHTSRTALWITMNGVAQVIGCLLMYGVARNSSLSLQPWRTLFLICGAITSAAGIAFYFMIPNGPKDAWFFTPREKEVMALRMAADREGGDKTNFSMAQLKETLLDPKAWFVFWFGVLVTMQSPVLTFASLVIKSLGADKFQTILYTAPSGAVQILLLWIGVLLCYLVPRNRTAVAFCLCIPPLVGNVLLMKLTVSAGWGLIVASWLVCLPFSVHISDMLTCFSHPASQHPGPSSSPSPPPIPRETQNAPSSTPCSSSATAPAALLRLNCGLMDPGTFPALSLPSSHGVFWRLLYWLIGMRAGRITRAEMERSWSRLIQRVEWPWMRMGCRWAI